MDGRPAPVWLPCRIARRKASCKCYNVSHCRGLLARILQIQKEAEALLTYHPFKAQVVYGGTNIKRCAGGAGRWRCTAEGMRACGTRTQAHTATPVTCLRRLLACQPCCLTMLPAALQ